MPDQLEILKKTIDALIRVNNSIFEIGKSLYAANKNLYVFDILIFAVLNRVVNINRGFINEINDNNFFCAAPLLRLQLDSFLRLYATTMIDYDIDDFASQVINKIPVRELKDSNGKKLTDSHIVNTITQNKELEWIKTIYKKTSGFIHLSEEHVYSSSKINNNSSVFEAVISKNDSLIPINIKIETVIYQKLITKAIIEFVEQWINRKIGYNNLHKA
jgi:hypothetical protein